MARSIRATSLLLIALGAAAPALPASAAAANAGGAAPGSEVASPAPTSSDAVGGAAPGVTPAQRASSSGVGGALPGRKPARRKVVRRRVPRPAPKTGTRGPVASRPLPPAPPVTTISGTFPVQGPFSFGGDDARFGAGRPGHIHQGQDVVAASGEPLVAPVSGTVTWKANQEGGAGIYLVVRGTDPTDVRDYVFMHLLRGSVLVAPGDAVAAGQQLAQVGATGAASGPHLHFEIWIGGWYVRGGAPVDPLPQLQRWAGL
jgi:murein DD-endopeptidase MepM/ murein hydrolase activator NlpD